MFLSADLCEQLINGRYRVVSDISEFICLECACVCLRMHILRL